MSKKSSTSQLAPRKRHATERERYAVACELVIGKETARDAARELQKRRRMARGRH